MDYDTLCDMIDKFLIDDYESKTSSEYALDAAMDDFFPGYDHDIYSTVYVDDIYIENVDGMISDSDTIGDFDSYLTKNIIDAIAALNIDDRIRIKDTYSIKDNVIVQHSNGHYELVKNY